MLCDGEADWSTHCLKKTASNSRFIDCYIVNEACTNAKYIVPQTAGKLFSRNVGTNVSYIR